MVAIISSFRFEDVGLEILLNNAEKADPIEQREQVHFVQNSIQPDINEQIHGIIDGEVAQKDLIFDKVALSEGCLKLNHMHKELFNDHFFVVHNLF